VLNGAIPIFVILLGVFIVWLEWDEWKIERELAKEEKKLEKEKKRRKK
jgi:cell division protein FtsL